ncbi:DUF6567 family protein [Cyclobacterium sp.]|uniref:DUF6567 family protein n=1 Tax=Cyclobacterium sp. TaxID=1966343 RepID=UPI003970DAF2
MRLKKNANKWLVQCLLLSIVSFIFLSACSTSGMPMSSSLTNVQLSEANYQIVARSVSGESKAGYILGVSFGVGMYSQVIGVARGSGDRAL